MLTSFLANIVDFSRRFARLIVLAAFIASLGLGTYVATHIRINTDINQLLSDKPVWRQREKQLETAFPQKTDNLVIVLDADTADKAERAAAELAQKLAAMPDKFTMVSRPDALAFFRANGLLYLSKDELGGVLDQLAQAQPMMATISSDPSLRGFFSTISLMAKGLESGAVDPVQIQGPLKAITGTVESALAGKDQPLDWQSMMPGPAAPQAAQAKRKYILTKPVLNYNELEPGAEASALVRQQAAELGITAANGFALRLTGDVALNDEEFASVAQGTGFATLLSALLVFGLLFMAMRTWRIVLPIILTLGVGLVASTAFATAAVGSLNLISVAFAVMFIGIAVDFSIQFGVRYRDQHHKEPDHAKALVRTAQVIALPLAMAAGSTALGFLSFIPTDYRGVSELGLIAGVGMLIAFALNITLLPALMSLTKPPAERETIGYAALAPLNHFLLTQRARLIPLIAFVALLGLAGATKVGFDFDPLDLKDPHTESVTTMFDAIRDPNSDAYAAQILTPSQQDAEQLAGKLRSLPEVDHVMTLESFIPEDQDKKLAMIGDTVALLAPTLAAQPRPAPGEEENLAAIHNLAAGLHGAGDQIPEAKALADALDQVAAHASPDLLQRLQNNLISPMRAKMGEIGGMLQAHPVTLADIPPELRRDWVAADGKWLIEIFPKRAASDNPRDPKMLEDFIAAVQKIAPDVAGAPVSIRESGRTIISAFIHAGIYALISISVLALLILRKPRDVLLMIAPLVIAGIFSLATITAVGLPLNFANIIALPLLLSLGVSYAVYFVSYWRSGQEDLLQSSMARAILFSAATVLVAFASLCFSSHPGTRGMGILLTIALLYSLLCTFLILPVLLGKSRTDKSS